MTFNTKGARARIKRLMGGDTSHHTNTKLIQMRLSSGSLTENDEENVSVFASHFKKVLKSMLEENWRHHFDFITEFWEEKVDF